MDTSLDIEVVIRWLTFLPIVLCSVFGLAITLAKWRQLRRPVLPDDSTLAILRRHIEVEDFDVATEHGMNDTRPGSRLVAVAARCASRPRENVKEQMTMIGAQLAADVEYGLGGLALLTTLGPLLGLLGTVVGVVVVFNRLAASVGVATAQPEESASAFLRWCLTATCRRQPNAASPSSRHSVFLRSTW